MTSMKYMRYCTFFACLCMCMRVCVCKCAYVYCTGGPAAAAMDCTCLCMCVCVLHRRVCLCTRVLVCVLHRRACSSSNGLHVPVYVCVYCTGGPAAANSKSTLVVIFSLLCVRKLFSLTLELDAAAVVCSVKCTHRQRRPPHT